MNDRSGIGICPDNPNGRDRLADDTQVCERAHYLFPDTSQQQGHLGCIGHRLTGGRNRAARGDTIDHLGQISIAAHQRGPDRVCRQLEFVLDPLC